MYLVAKVDGRHCYLHKFVNGQIRSKRYIAKLSEIYIISKSSESHTGQATEPISSSSESGVDTQEAEEVADGGVAGVDQEMAIVQNSLVENQECKLLQKKEKNDKDVEQLEPDLTEITQIAGELTLPLDGVQDKEKARKPKGKATVNEPTRRFSRKKPGAPKRRIEEL